jgi:hypothetical protein
MLNDKKKMIKKINDKKSMIKKQVRLTDQLLILDMMLNACTSNHGRETVKLVIASVRCCSVSSPPCVHLVHGVCFE